MTETMLKRLFMGLLGGVLFGAASGEEAVKVEMSAFCQAQTPGKYILAGEDDEWTWGMAPIYDKEGKLHIFNSVIPRDGSWIKHSKIIHWTADSVEGPFTLVGDVFASEEASYHNPQISQVGDTYVLVYLLINQ